MNSKPDLVLGTAEFGHPDYAPFPEKKEIVKILNLAWNNGIRLLDTADTYNLEELEGLFGGFKKLNKSRTDKEAFYHYKPLESRIEGVKKASVYDLAQLEGLKEAILPLNINNTTFASISWGMGTKRYARSVFDKGRLLSEGYSIQNCLDFVKRHPVDGVIVGVRSVDELLQVLNAW
jgi:hypothetical protein